MSLSVRNQNIVEDTENRGLRRGKREENLPKATAQGQNGTKRVALGAITNQIRRQPFRAAKQQPFGIHDENGPVKGKTFSSAPPAQVFSIHVDEKPALLAKLPSPTLPSSEELPSAITSLHTHNEELDDVILVEESPMVLDVSHTEIKPTLSEKERRENVILGCAEYANDIYAYLREAELKHRPKASYMRKQPDITNSMRSILVDWLVEVADEYKLHRETLFLAVNYIDRFLSQMSVLRGKLQLVGAASMFLAAKYEEIYPPEVGEFVYITDDTYNKKQVLRMEHLVLKVLSFDVAVPTINVFCDWYMRCLDADDTLSSLVMYLSELTLVDSDPYLKYLPSEIATASMSLANYTINGELWNPEMQRVSGYQFESIESCLQDLYSTFCNAPNHAQQAVREKYKLSKYHQVANLDPPTTLPVAMQ